jgi:hypothetical protein
LGRSSLGLELQHQLQMPKPLLPRVVRAAQDDPFAQVEGLRVLHSCRQVPLMHARSGAHFAIEHPSPTWANPVVTQAVWPVAGFTIVQPCWTGQSSLRGTHEEPEVHTGMSWLPSTLGSKSQNHREASAPASPIRSFSHVIGSQQ